LQIATMQIRVIFTIQCSSIRIAGRIEMIT
jgi:hypothetical protein